MKTITVEIPDVLAAALSAEGKDPRRAVLEAMALEGYRTGRLTEADLKELLGFETRMEVHGFLKDHGAVMHYTAEDLDQDSRVANDVARKFEKESGLWVLRTGQLIDPAVVARTLAAIREERDLG
jgi:Uncharacterised protein family (UPF0175)